MLTFPPMIDSELSRFVLSYQGLSYREDRHLIGLAWFLTFLHGGRGRIPLVYGSGLRLNGARAIVDHGDEVCHPSRILVPAQQPLRTHVEADWATFNAELSTCTAQIAYFHLLPQREIMVEVLERGMAPAEAKFVPTLYPALRWLLTQSLHLGPQSAADAVGQTRRIVGEVERRLADGRDFLWGKGATLADLSFATALAPLLLPEGYTAPTPAYDQMPAELARIVDEFRARPAAAFVSRVYQLRK